MSISACSGRRPHPKQKNTNMTMHNHLKLLAACALASPLFLTGQIITSYEATISTPADGGGGPALWYQNADSATGTAPNIHILNSGSAGANSSTHQAFRLGGQTYTDYFGNADNAFGIDISGNAAAVSGSSDLFMTGQQGTVSFLFQTPSTLANASLFRQSNTNSFELFLLGSGSTGNLRMAVENNLTTLPTLSTNTWYYFAARWNADQGAGNDEFTWYLGVAGGTTLSSGGINIVGTNTGASGSIEIAGRSTTNKFPGAMQQFAVWERELSGASIDQQFTALVPEPGTYALLLGFFGLGFVLIRRRLRP
jgi:hypothetical protein